MCLAANLNNCLPNDRISTTCSAWRVTLFTNVAAPSKYSPRASKPAFKVSLLAEHEVTKLVQLVSEIARRLDIPETSPETEEMKRTVAPEAVLEAIQSQQVKR